MFEEVVIDDLKRYEDLSYKDYGDNYVELYHNDELIGDIEVFTDSGGEEEREYIIINNEVVYLHTIKQSN